MVRVGRGQTGPPGGRQTEIATGYTDRGPREKDKWQARRKWDGEIAFRNMEIGESAEQRRPRGG